MYVFIDNVSFEVLKELRKRKTEFMNEDCSADQNYCFVYFDPPLL